MMEQYESINRRGSGSLKWDSAGENELALWVADMDFASPRIVIDALSKRLQHAVFGYAKTDPTCAENFAAWCTRRQGWTPATGDLVLNYGMLGAIGIAIELYSLPGDAIAIQTPVYHPFATIPGHLGRRLVRNPLHQIPRGDANPYCMNFEALETLFRIEKPRIMILCSPHNPVGRVWSRAELETLLEICVRYGVLLVSDEIHADLILPGYPFVSVGALVGQGKPFPASAAIVLQAPSKTFNIPGLPSCFAYVPDNDIRKKLREGISGLGMSTLNILSQTACAAAYGGGDSWLDEVLGLLQANYGILARTVTEWQFRWPRWAEGEHGIGLTCPEGTYLAWLRMRPAQEALGKGNLGLQAWLRADAKVFLSAGTQFGEEGDNHLRLNVGTHRETLEQALERIQASLDTLYSR